MRAVITRSDGTINIRFVPKDGADAAGAAKAAKTGDAKEVPEAAAGEDAVKKTNPSDPDSKFGGLNLDLPIDVVPAFMALDVSPTDVNEPTTPREFGAALLSGVDRSGTLQTGLAVEFAPFRVLGMHVDQNAYNEEGPSGIFNRIA